MPTAIEEDEHAAEKTTLMRKRDKEIMASEGGAHSGSSFGLDYWLRRCEGFRVEGPGGRIGQVRGIRFDRSAEPEVLEVGAGFLGRRTLLVAVKEVLPSERRLILRGTPRLLDGEHAEEG